MVDARIYERLVERDVALIALLGVVVGGRYNLSRSSER